jgi:threonyl-tRNA synthetase
MIDRPSAETLTLTLPDGSERSVPAGTLPSEVVKSIGERLLMAAVAVELNGKIQDLVTPLRSSGTFKVLTDRDITSLDVLRHSAAHVLATAVRRLRPDARIGFGPSIDDGFYYDFEVAQPFTPEDLAGFEKEMHKVAQEKYPFVREEVSRGEAQQRFADDPLKLERLSELGEDEIISTYTDGPFIDLCRGPHVPDTSRLKHFKLTHTAGAYWRGDSNRQMLQRIYGTAFFKKDELEGYLLRIEEAKKRDHRVVGRQLDLFMMHQFSPGAVFWTERGTTLYNALQDFIRERQRDDFNEIKTPLLYNKGLWEISGHWGKYRENMFLVLDNETQAEAALRGALDATGMEYEMKPGDGAFYGPKIDFDVMDSIGRPWQLGTIQLDYNAPERFDLSYVGEDNNAHRPVVIHRAVSGSLERFIAILIEHFAGAFPVWLAPEQVRVLPITDDYREYAEQVTKQLHAAGVRVHLDSRSETLKYRVAEGARMKVPYMVVVGRREAETQTVAVNVRGAGEKQKPNSLPLGEFVSRVVEENRSRALTLEAHG